MEANVEALAQEILSSLSQDERYLLGLVGPPASGKSTLAAQLVDFINRGGQSRAIVLPMDGYHYSNEYLEELGLLNLKGVPRSFDVEAFVSLVESVKRAPDDVHLAPEFRREIEASIPNAIEITPKHQVVVVEGNYLLMDEEPWTRLGLCFDEVWFLSLDESTRQERLLKRHIENGRSVEEAAEKIRETDDPNSKLVDSTMSMADRIVEMN